jgi:trimeric autotransporter adhesin
LFVLKREPCLFFHQVSTNFSIPPTVKITNGNNVVLNDINALVLGASTVSGTLDVTTSGAITDSGNLTVTGATTLTAGAGNNITLNKNNNFSTVSIASGKNVTLKDTGAINLGNSTVSGNLSVTAAGLIDFTGAGASTVGGTMGLTTTAGGISDSGGGTLAVAGTGTLNATGAGNNITLDNANNFSTVKITNGNNVVLNDINALDLGASTVSGNLDVTTGTSLTDSGNVTAAGLKFTAGTTVDLDSANNDFDTIAGTSNGAVTLNDKDSFSVGTVNGAIGINSTNNDISLTSGGDITLDKEVNAGSGDATLTAVGFIQEGGPTDDAAPVADVIAENIYLNSKVASPGDALGLSTSYLDLQVTDPINGSWNASVPNGGSVYINCIGDCPIGQVDVGTGTFNFSTTGQLIDGNDDVFGEAPLSTGTWNIRAGGINIKTGAGFGTATDGIETRLSNYGGAAGDGRAAIEGGTGGVFLANKSMTGFGLTIGSVAGSFVSGTNSQTGTIIYSQSPLTVAADVTDTLGGNITLSALGAAAADDLTVNANINITTSGGANTGSILLTAGDTVTLNSGSIVTASGSGDVKIYAGEDYTNGLGVVRDGNTGASGGDISMVDGAVASSGSGKLILDAADDIALSSVQTTSNASDAITVTARAGAVTDAGDTHTDIITGATGTVVIDSVLGVGAGNALETSVGHLDIDNSTSGNIQIVEVASGGDLGINKAAQGNSGGINIQTRDGNLTVNAGQSGVSLKNGAITLWARDSGAAADKNLIINDTVTSNNGKVNLDAANDVIFSADGDVTTVSGEIEVLAGKDNDRATGAVTMVDGTVLNAGNDIIDIDAVGDITLGLVTTTNNGVNAVNITTTAGAIKDTADVAAVDIVTGATGRATLKAVTGIGSGDAIETSIGELDVTNATTNHIKIDEIAAGGNLDVIKAWQTGAGTGDMVIRVLGGDLTVAAGQSGVSAQGGATTLYSVTSDVLVNDTVTSTTGKITLDADSDVIFSAAGDVTSTSGEVEVEANKGQVLMADGTLIDAGNGLIDIDAQTDVTLGGLKTTNTTSNTTGTTSTAVVIVSRAGAIVDAVGVDAYTNIETGATGGILLSAKTGIGSAKGITTSNGNDDTKNAQLAAVTDTGNIQIFHQGGLDITSVKDDNDPTTQFVNTGAGTVTGVSILDTAATDPAGYVFITSASPMTISSAVLNSAGGDITLYALGATTSDTMTINANVRTEGGDGDVRMVSGSSMTFGANVTVSTAGDGKTSGTGDVILGAGYDASLATATEPAATLVGPGGTAGDTGADITMTPSSRVTTEDGNILVDAQDNFTVGLLHADGGDQGIDLSDGIRGDVTTFSRNGSTLDADAAATSPQNLNIYAETWNGTAGGSIGAAGNPIETNAPTQNLNGAGGVYVTDAGSVLLNADSANGSIQFQAAGDILLGHAHAGNGQVSLTAGNSILSQGGATHVIASDVIKLVAGGVVGTASDAIQTQLNNAGNLFLEARGQSGPLSANIQGNFTRASVQFLNTPPGLVFFNGIIAGGATVSLEEGSVSTLYYNPNPVSLPAYGQFDGRYSADFPAVFDQNRFAFAPVTSINTGGIDVMPIEGLGILPPVVPIPTPAIPPTPIPAPEAGRPPLTVPLPGPAQPPAPQSAQEQATGPVYVAPGRGSQAAASSISGQQAGLAESERKKKKKQKQGSEAPLPTPPLVVPIPASAQPPVHGPRTENNNLPFYMNPLSQTVRMVRDRMRQGQSPAQQNESANAGTGSASSPAGLSTETARH